MTIAKEFALNARLIKDRLWHPPNAVYDVGIDLKRPRGPMPQSREPQQGPVQDKVLEYHQPPTDPPPSDNQKPTASFYFYYPKRVSIPEVIRTVACHYCIWVHDIRGRSRRREICFPRQVAFYLAWKHGGGSYSVIGRVFNRDHTTIMHGVHRIKSKLKVIERVKNEIEAIEEK